MERYICIHAHFYQPPRENPWLETVEAQPSAYPFHDWNERITAECYAPNGASRIVDEQGRILEIVNNYSKISFNFGATLLSWLKDKSPEVYESILEADRLSQKQFSGHGSAMAQGYNHMILPLANRADKETQIVWGIRDFESRFGRTPEGMWLPETAVDLESLDIMAEQGLKFAVLAPSQAGKVRALEGKSFKDVGGAKIDPTQAYEVKLPSGRTLALFFYDGPISRAVAFEKLLNTGVQFAQRLMSGFSDERDWPQLMHIATDGESYGHHHPHGDMALAYALRYIEEKGLAKLTNYGEFLEKHPPQVEVQIIERTAWSCSHGVERWNSDCGCRASDNGWNQKWRGPLRGSLDWLRDNVNPLYEHEARKLLKDPWTARNDYIRIILNRTSEQMDRFFANNQDHLLSARERTRALQLLELQRHAMLMFTSCGWFFDEVSGIEGVKVLEYAGRVIQLSQEVFPAEGKWLEIGFLQKAAEAKSNVTENGDAAKVYQKWVVPAMADLRDVGAHYAISSLFELNAADVPIYCYVAEREDFQILQSGRARVALGRARITSKITLEHELLSFAVLHVGDHNLNAGVRESQEEATYAGFAAEMRATFSRADLPEAVRLMDRYFGGTKYSLKSLFGDERNRILHMLLEATLHEAEGTYRQVYESHASLLQFLGAVGMEQPRILAITSEFVVNANLRQELSNERLNSERIRNFVDRAKMENIPLDHIGLGFAFQKSLSAMMERLADRPEEFELLVNVSEAVELASSLNLPVNLWRVQNLYFDIAKQYVYGSFHFPPEWPAKFLALGEQLCIRVDHADRLGQPQAAA